jgi:hypothetical protein
MFEEQINAIYAPLKEKHKKLVSDPRYIPMFCTFDDRTQVLYNKNVAYIRGLMANNNDFNHTYEFLYNVSREEFNLKFTPPDPDNLNDKGYISTPHHVKIRDLKPDDSPLIYTAYVNHIVTIDDVNLFSGYQSPYASSGRYFYETESQALDAFKDYVSEMALHFDTLLCYPSTSSQLVC